MSKTPPLQIAAHLSQTSDAPPPCSHRPAPASPPSLPDRPSSAIPSTPPAKMDATGRRTCRSDRPPPSTLLSTLLRDCRFQHALSATLPPAPQDSESAATPQTSGSRGAPLSSYSTLQTRSLIRASTATSRRLAHALQADTLPTDFHRWICSDSPATPAAPALRDPR